MQDTTIKGSGNSRLLKMPPNAVTLYESLEAFLSEAATNGIPCDLSNLQAAGTTIFGTPYAKSTVLPDSLCSALGLPTTATPAQALDKLRTLISAVDGKIKIAKGSYVGTASYPIEIKIGFAPKMVIVDGSINDSDRLTGGFSIGVQGGMLKSISCSFVVSSYYTRIIASGRLTNAGFVIENTTNDQFAFSATNASGQTYHYFAIG